VESEELADGWGSVKYSPTGSSGIVLKGGAMERTPDRYEENASGSGRTRSCASTT